MIAGVWRRFVSPPADIVAKAEEQNAKLDNLLRVVRADIEDADRRIRRHPRD